MFVVVLYFCLHSFSKEHFHRRSVISKYLRNTVLESKGLRAKSITKPVCSSDFYDIKNKSSFNRSKSANDNFMKMLVYDYISVYYSIQFILIGN